MYKVSILSLLIANIIFYSTITAQDLSAPQTFTINTQRDTTLVTSSGTRLEIEENSFDHSSINNPIKNIKIIVEEALEKDDMILSGVSTESQETALVSDGMIKVTAKLEERDLNLAKGKSIRVSLPTQDGVDTDMALYELNRGYWEKQKKKLTFDTCKLIIKRIIWEYKKASKKEYKEWKRSTPEQEKPQRLFGGKEINLFSSPKREYRIPIPIDTIWTCAREDTAFYKFNIQLLGWNNIDKPWRFKNSVKIKIKTNKKVKAFLIIRDKKVCLRGRPVQNFYRFRSIKKNSRIALVCYTVINDKILYSIKEMIAKEDATITVDGLKEISSNDFKKQIEQFR